MTESDLIKQFLDKLAASVEPDLPSELIPRVTFTEVGDQLDVDAFGVPMEKWYMELLRELTHESIAPVLRSIHFSGPDEGVNGIRNWNIEALIAPGVEFSGLEELRIERYRIGEHNRPIVAYDHYEEGVLAEVLRLSPSLRILVAPSAPDGDFFQVGERPLETLCIDAGLEHQNFLANLAASNCFPELCTLEWGEFNETYMEEWEKQCTPLADYQALFKSEALAGVGSFVLRNPVISDAEIAALKALHPDPDFQFCVIRQTMRYV